MTVPGLLEKTIRERYDEFHYAAFSPFAIELVCLDLRARRDHLVTQPYSKEIPKVQDAIDRQLGRNYRRNLPRQWELLMSILLGEPWYSTHGPNIVGTFASYRNHVYFPRVLRPAIETRWREVGYDSLSAYLTGLIRYDLILCGPHTYFNGADRDPELLAALDAETVTTFQSRRRQRILLDYLIEEAAGRHLTDAERDAEMRRLSELLRNNALRPQRRAERVAADR